MIFEKFTKIIEIEFQSLQKCIHRIFEKILKNIFKLFSNIDNYLKIIFKFGLLGSLIIIKKNIHTQ